MRGRDDRSILEMMQDQIALDRINTWGEWNFMAKGVAVEHDGFEDFNYDVITIDLENRRIQADIVGYNQSVKELLRETVDSLENEYGYITPNISSDLTREEEFPPEPVPGKIYWMDEETWMLETSEFKSLSESLFGYDILSSDYERIRPEAI